MSEAERAAEERRARRMAELDDGFEKYPIGVIPYLARRFPIPSTEGMSPVDAEATLDKWRAEVNEFIAASENRPATPSATPPAQPAAAPEAPVA